MLSGAGRLFGIAALAAVALHAGAEEPPPASGAAPGPATATVWDGIYTEAQAARGRAIYAAPCGRCHGARLDGAPDDPDMLPSPPIGGWKFFRNWNGRTLGTLYEYTRTNMPANNPASLSAQEFADLIAYMLLVSGAPAGAAELAPDPVRLAGVAIRPQP